MSPTNDNSESTPFLPSNIARSAGSTPYDASANTVAVWPSIPGYEILRELGKGGMGVVYEAKQLNLARSVALKLMKGDDLAYKARFLAEGKMIAAVKHPNVVEVYESGECPDGPFIAMEYLPGGSFGARMKSSTGPNPREIAGLLAKIAAGVGAAHTLGIVHRDLKPDNVLLDRDGTPKVTDFGLAKQITMERTEQTRTDAVAGTYPYMSPEQATSLKCVGPPADVWSLGVMLYEALTGKRPFVGESLVDLFLRIKESEPSTLRSISLAIPADLETICLKCLEKEPKSRYATANEMAADLHAWLDGRPISAKRATRAERLILWVRRKPTVAAAWLLGFIVVSLAILSISTMNLWQAAMAEKVQAEQKTESEISSLKKEAEVKIYSADVEAKDAKRERKEADTRDYTSKINLAFQRYQNDELIEANDLLKSCSKELREWEWHYVNRLCNPRLIKIEDVAARKIQAAFVENGSKILTLADYGKIRLWDTYAGEETPGIETHDRKVIYFKNSPVGENILMCFSDGSATVYGTNTRERVYDDFGVQKFGRLRRSAYGSFNTDGKHVVIGDSYNTAKICNLESGKVVVLKAHTDTINCSSFSPDGNLVATGGNDKKVLIWDAVNGSLLKTIDCDIGKIRAAEFCGDGKMLWCTGENRESRVVRIETAQIMPIFGEERLESRSVCIGPDGKMAITSNDRTIKLYDISEKGVVFRRSWPNRNDFMASFDSDGKYVLGLDLEGYPTVCDIETGKALYTIPWTATFAFFHPNGTRICFGSGGPSIQVWDVRLNKVPHQLRGHNSRIMSAAYNRDGTRILSVSADGTAVVWDRKYHAKLLTIRNVRSATYSDDSSTIVTTKSDNSSVVYDARTGNELSRVYAHAGKLLATHYSKSGLQVASSDSDGRVSVENIHTGKTVFSVQAHMRETTRAAFSSDGVLIVTDSIFENPKIWNVQTAQEICTLQFRGGIVCTTPFSYKNDLVIAEWNGHAATFDVKTGSLGNVFGGKTNRPTSGVFDGSGLRFFTVHGDKSVNIWSPQFKENHLTFRSHAEASIIACSPDGWQILTGNDDGTITLYDATPASWYQVLRP